ncbi:MAG: DUF3971 domain-containing protein [Candidatus Paracaedibacteraceae bacterium]|nr:DUF3971 domain-containing protein [Candidatus Paracaedibacteraceae bacterium]
MNAIKNIRRIAAIILGTMGMMVAGLFYYLSTPSIQTKIAQEFTHLLTTHDYPPDQVTLQSTEWGGILNPLSIRVKQVVITHKDLELRLKKLKLGLNPLSLLHLNLQIKQITIREGHLLKNHQPLIQLNGSLYLKGNSISYRLKDFSCNLKDLAPFHPRLTSLQTVDIPLSIKSNGFFDGEKDVRGNFEVFLKPGKFTLSPYYSESVEISEGKIEVHLHSNKLEWSISNLKSQNLIGKASGSLKSPSLITALREATPIHLMLKGTVEEMPVDQIKIYWPIGLATKARTWVTTNLSNGSVPRATLTLNGHLLAGAHPSLSIDHLRGDIDATGVDVAYLGNLPKITQTHGYCTYTKSNFIISAAGNCYGMPVEDAYITISGFDNDEEQMAIDLKVRGPLEKALNLIAQNPLELPQKLGIDPTLFTGDALTHLKLTFPLRSDLPLDQIQAYAHSQISAASLLSSHFPFGIQQPLTHGQFDLHVTNSGLLLKGTGLVVGHPAHISAKEVFNSKETNLIIQADDEATDAYLGPFEISYKNKALTAKADLSKIDWHLNAIRYVKEKDQPGFLDLTATVTNDKALAISKIDLFLGEAHIQGYGQIDLKNTDLKLDHVAMGDLKGKLTITGNPTNLNIKGLLQTLDLDPILQNFETTSQVSNISVAADLEINKVLLSNKINFGAAKASLTWEKGELSSLALISTTPDSLAIHMAPTKNGKHSFSVACQNAGNLIDYFNPNDDLEGGHLIFAGELEENHEKLKVNGELDLRHVTVIKAPLLAQILSISSLDGIVRTLSGQGIHFDHTVGKVRWEDNKFYLDDIHASGSSIALNLEGSIDTHSKIYNLHGELYPLNSLNFAMANIPLLGSVLSGGKNRGVFSTAFTVTGPFDDFKVWINPLSTIAPQGMKELVKKSSKP